MMNKDIAHSAVKRRWIAPRLETEYADITGVASKTQTVQEDTDSTNANNATNPTGPSS
jgi:hypothetical protein